MDFVVWAFFIAVVGLCILAIWGMARSARPKPPVVYPRPVMARIVLEPEAPAAPAYLRRWNGNRKAAARREHDLWQREFDSLYSWPAGPGVYRK